MYMNRIPVGGTATPTSDPRTIERRKKGTSLNNAVILEKDKQQKREQGFPNGQPHQEHPFEIYNAEADAEIVSDKPPALDITA